MQQCIYLWLQFQANAVWLVIKKTLQLENKRYADFLIFVANCPTWDLSMWEKKHLLTENDKTSYIRKEDNLLRQVLAE